MRRLLDLLRRIGEFTKTPPGLAVAFLLTCAGLILAVLGVWAAWPAAPSNSPIVQLQGLGADLEFADGALVAITIDENATDTLRILKILVSEQFPKLRRLYISTRLRNAELVEIGKLKMLTGLYLNDSNIGDAGLVHLLPLVRLETLGLAGTRVTDQGLQHVARFPALSVMNLSRTAVTNDGLRALSRMQSLKSIFLSGTAVSDGALIALAMIPQLDKVYVNGTGVTDKGVSSFLKSHPVQTLDVRDSKVTPAHMRAIKSKPAIFRFD